MALRDSKEISSIRSPILTIKEIVQSMERAARALQSSNGRDLKPANGRKGRAKGSLALKSAFPNDKLLQLLVTHLEHGIRQARSTTRDAVPAEKPNPTVRLNKFFADCGVAQPSRFRHDDRRWTRAN